MNSPPSESPRPPFGPAGPVGSGPPSHGEGPPATPPLRLVDDDDGRPRRTTAGREAGAGRETGEDLSQQDLRLMQRVASGDERAVRDLYDRFGALVFKAARQILPSRSEADDAVQEVFIRLWRTADRFDPQRAKLVTWVMLIARRHLIDRLRRTIASPAPGTLESDWPGSSGPGQAGRPEQDPSFAERNQELRRRIANLPALQRVVIEKAYLQGFTLREVAEQLEAPLGTVKSALSRGLAKLREELASAPDFGTPTRELHPDPGIED